MELLKDKTTKDESYAERRQLFKNIWETAMQVDDKDEVMKPKVIKTLRVDDMDKYVIGKSKKEKLRNLRVICNKILDFCDRQEDDMFFHQITGEPKLVNRHPRGRKLKTRAKRKVRRRKNIYASINTEVTATEFKPTTSDVKDGPASVKTLKNVLPSNFNNKPIARMTFVSSFKSPSYPTNTNTDNRPAKISTFRRRVVRKKRSKRKKTSGPVKPPSSGTPNHISAGNATLKGRAVLRHVKQLLAANNITVSNPKKQTT